MIVYLVATLIACALAWRGTKVERKWPWFVAAAVPLVLVSALRWDVGTDFYYTYFPVYRAMECRDLGGSEELVVLGFALETLVAVWVFNKNEVLPYGISRRPDHSPPRVRFATRPFGWQLPGGM